MIWSVCSGILFSTFQITELNTLETKKKFQLCERTCAALYTYLSFFTQCHQMVPFQRILKLILLGLDHGASNDQTQH
jgi:hypothetical protein